MTTRLPSLSALRAFEAAGQHLSFTRAARELNVTQTAISHQVKALEDDLGVVLFVRRPRGLALTEAGRAFLLPLSEAFRTLQQATNRLRRQGTEQTVTITVLPSFAAKWLVPRLIRFRERYPAIDVRMSASHTLIDFAASDVDLGVRFGRGMWPGLRIEHFMEETATPICAPSLIDGDPPLRVLEDLRNHTLLHDEWFGDRHEQWRQWLSAMGITGVTWHRGPVFSDTSHSIQAAIEGQGVALGRSVLMADDVAAGRLVCPFPGHVQHAHAYYVVSAEGVPDSTPVAAFRAWLHDEAKLAGIGPSAEPPTKASGGRWAREKKKGPENRPQGRSSEGRLATSRRD